MLDGVDSTLDHLGDVLGLGAGLTGQGHVDQHCGAVDLDLIDQAEVDDVDRDLRVKDLTQLAVDFFGGRHGKS